MDVNLDWYKNKEPTSSNIPLTLCAIRRLGLRPPRYAGSLMERPLDKIGKVNPVFPVFPVFAVYH
jgi:hypothetical protein